MVVSLRPGLLAITVVLSLLFSGCGGNQPAFPPSLYIDGSSSDKSVGNVNSKVPLPTAAKKVTQSPAVSFPHQIVETNCAPQNIHYNSQLGILSCDSAVAVSDPNFGSFTIFCKEGTYSEDSGTYSCIGGTKLGEPENVRHVIKPLAINRDALFQKKQECQKLFLQIQQQLRADDESIRYANQTTTLEQVFYSVSMNSCLYTSNTQQSYASGGASFITFWLKDALTGKGLMDVTDIQNNYYKARQQFENYLTRYQ